MKARRLSKGMPAGMSLLAIFALLASLLPGGYRAAYAEGAAVPEEWHDGSEGTADEGRCVAFGWAVDPDDRDRDVLVQILADGQPDPIAAAYASDYGEDMDQLGICPGGTCRFTISLWDLISHDVAHEITVQAYDEETTAWVGLQGTPRTLTCTTPPPYVFLVAFPEWWSVEGYGWPAGVTVHMAIDDPATPASPDYQQDEPVVPTPWDPTGYYVKFNFWPDYQLKPGDVVTLDDGSAPATHVVRSLSVTAVDVAASTVAGTADPGVEVYVNPYEDWGKVVMATAAGDGSWLADFTGVFDFALVTGGRSQIIDGAGNRTAVDWSVPPPPPAPYFRAFPEQEFVDGGNWPLDAVVHLAIDDPGTAPSPDYEQDATVITSPWDPAATFVLFDLAGVYDLKRGDAVSLSSNGLLREQIVHDVWIMTVDPTADSVGGTAAPGALVHVLIGGDVELFVTAGLGGDWLADFSTVGFDVLPSMDIAAEVWDADGDSTITNWWAPPPPPTPWLTAFPEWEYVEAVDWAVGVPVHLAIDDPGTPDSPDYQADTTTFIPDWESNPERGWALFPLDGYDLKAGDLVMMTGSGFTLEHVVRKLSVTGVDVDANTVAGTADPGVQLQAWEHGQPEVNVTAGDDGVWLADFTGFYDLTYGTGGRAWIIGEGGNATAVQWDAPPPPPIPWLIAFPEYEAVEGWEWPLGATVHLAIDDPATGISPDYEADGIAAETWWGDPRTYFRLEFGGAYDLKVGDVVVLSDGASTAVHVVQNLSVIMAQGAADFLAGRADPGAHIWTWPHGFDQDATLEVTAGAGGVWLANFRGVFDLAMWTGGRAQILDEGGNATAVDWVVTGPASAAATEVILPANAGWMDTGFAVWEGVPVNVTAGGQARTGISGAYATSHSGPDGQGWSCWDFDGLSPCALGGAPYGALIGRIGPDGEPFLIGANFVFDPAASGLLYLAVNDNLPHYGDNKGSYIVVLSY